MSEAAGGGNGAGSEDVLRAEDLGKTYSMGEVDVHARRGVDLAVERGEFVSIMGSSGSGKSTLLHVVGGLLAPSFGEVFIEHRSLSAMSDGERTDLRRRRIGFVFQRFNLFPTLSLDGNLKLAERVYSDGGSRPAVDPGFRETVLEQLGLVDKKLHKPTELSGGEQQRVAIARAVLHQPAILLADEPAGNLDSETSRRVLDMLRLMHEEWSQTILMITHNPEAAATGNRLLRMRDGRIVEDGGKISS